MLKSPLMAGAKDNFKDSLKNKKISIPLIFIFITIVFWDYFVSFFGTVLTPGILIGLLIYSGFQIIKYLADTNEDIKKIRKNSYKFRKKSIWKKPFIKYPLMFIEQIPRAIWFMAAIIGIFISGLLVGYYMEHTPEKDFSSTFEGKDVEYRDLISSYEELNVLYVGMMEDMGVLMDFSTWEENPESVYNAIERYRSRRDEIFFHQGKISEKRERANLGPASTN